MTSSMVTVYFLAFVVLFQVNDVYCNPFKYLLQLQETVFDMVDSDDSGAISFTEAQRFLSTPNIPEVLQNVLRENQLDTADSNNNRQLERFEVQVMLANLLRNSNNPVLTVLSIVSFKVQLMIRNEELSVPETIEEIADKLLSTLDDNRDSRLSMEEARVYFLQIGTQRFWEDFVLAAAAVDKDSDQQLSQSEIIACYKALQMKYGDMTARPLVIYSVVKDALGEFPVN